MIKKRNILTAISLLVAIGILTACGEKTEEVMIPVTLGIMATDAELSAMYASEPQEPDASGADIDYLEYIHPIEPLLNGKTWLTPTEIDPDDLLMWYVARKLEQNGAGLSGNQATEAAGYRVPRAVVEDSVSKYFGEVGNLLRDGLDEEAFNPETDEYVLPSLISVSPRSICITKVEEQGQQRNLFFTVTGNQTSKDYLLSLVEDGDSFRYLSLTDQDGNVGDSK